MVSNQEPQSESRPDLQSLRLNKTALATPSTRPGHSGRRWWLWLGVPALLIGGGWLWKRQQPVEVKTTTVTVRHPSQALTKLSASGYVVAQRKAAIASKATGRLIWLGVTEGDRVKADQIIARLDGRDVEATLKSSTAQAQAQQAQITGASAELRDAEQAYQRAQKLIDERFISQAALDQARARLTQAQSAVTSATRSTEAARANVQAAAVKVDYTVIRAPFNGIVLTKQANVGDIVTPFSSAADSKGAVVTMADLSSLEVEADVSESSINTIKVGQPCEITLDAFPNDRFEGRVSRVVPTVDRSKATVMTKVQFLAPPANLLPEMSAKVNFLSAPLPKNRTPSKTVPATALDWSQPQPLVWVVQPSSEKSQKNPAEVKDGTSADTSGDSAASAPPPAQVSPVAVSLGEFQDGKYAIEGAIKPGDVVVLRPTDELKRKRIVRILP